MIAIIGCARSGTTYTTELLKQYGYRIGHEKCERDGISSWIWTVRATRAPYGDSKIMIREPITYFHQVRNPIDNIASCLTLKQISWDFIAKYIRMDPKNKILSYMKYWYYWNIFSEAIAVLTYRVEDPSPLLAYLKLPKKELDIPTNVNTRKHDDLTSADLIEADRDLYKKILIKAEEYGYYE